MSLKSLGDWELKRGTKALPASVKDARGTWRADRDGNKVDIITPGDPPQEPDYLTVEAKIVWQEEIFRVMVAGIEELDSSEFASYCSLEALCRDLFAKGKSPPISALAELRKKRELFGIAGPKSRVQRRDLGKSDNPFGKL